MDVVIDSSIWSLVFKRRVGVLNSAQRILRKELNVLTSESKARLTGPVRQELLSGIRDKAGFVRLRDRLRAFEDRPLEKEDFEEATRHYHVCQRVGAAGSTVDLLECAAAARRGKPILAHDPDFLRYAAHLPLALHVVRPN